MVTNYSDINDYELLYLVSESDEDAYNKLYAKYSGFIKSLTQKYLKKCKYLGVDFDDIYQIGCYGLSLAINHYNENNEALFYTFASIFINREIQTFIRNISRKKHNVLSDSISLDKEIDENGNTLECFFSSSQNSMNSFFEIQNSMDVLMLKHDLPFLQSLIFELKLNNFSNKEISQLLDVKYKSIDNAVTSIKNKFKKNKIGLNYINDMI